MQKVEKLGADRLRVLKALLAGGVVERRRIFPFDAAYHLVTGEGGKAPIKISDLVMSDLLLRALVVPQSVNLDDPKSSDHINYRPTTRARQVVEDKGFVYEDAQLTLIDEPAFVPPYGMDPLL